MKLQWWYYLCYTSAFSEVIYADFCAKILDRNFRLVDENSQILVVVFVSKLNFSFSFFVDENYRIFASSSSLWRILIYFRQRKFSFSSPSTKKHWIIFDHKNWNITLSYKARHKKQHSDTRRAKNVTRFTYLPILQSNGVAFHSSQIYACTVWNHYTLQQNKQTHLLTYISTTTTNTTNINNYKTKY